MDADQSSFTLQYRPGDIHFDRGAAADLSAILADHGCERALVVCGRNVGANDAVMDPVRGGLGDRLAGVFAETTAAKSIETAFEGVERMRELDADAIVGLGGGSSLDVATVMNAVLASGYELADVQEQLSEQGYVEVPDVADSLRTLVQVPTTLAGADLSAGSGIAVPMPSGETIGTGVGADELMPEAIVYDPALFETTPTSVLASSAMNGFDKGLEAIYSRHRTPITDATAVRGLGLLRESLPRLREADAPADVMDRAVVGTILVQYGISTRDALKISVIHAFGHTLRRRFGMQQGTAHAVMAPHVLRALFDGGYGRVGVLAEAFDVDGSGSERSEAVVEEVEAVRDGLGLPARLRDVEGTDRSELDRVARMTIDDPTLWNGPEGYDPSADELEALLENAW